MKPFARVAIALGLFVGVVLPVCSAADLNPPLKKNERIALVGGGLGERMNIYGNFETLLHSRFPQLELVVRNFCWPADEVARRQRPNDYTAIDDPLKIFEPDTFICFFGYSAWFAGPAGIDKFKTDYEAFLTDYAKRYGRDGQARFILVSPIAFENSADPLLPDGAKENQNLRLYSEAVRDVARTRNTVYADLFTPSSARF